MNSPTSQNRGLLLSSFNEPMELVNLPMPTASTGTVVVAVLASFIAPSVEKIYSGKLGFNLPLPMTPGYGCIGRIHDIGPDATKLHVGDLVFVDPFLRARDDENTAILLGHFEGVRPAGRALMERVWRNGPLQKFLAVPLENCIQFEGGWLSPELSYSPAELMTLLPYAVAAGPLLETANLQPGETIIIGPAGGTYGGAAVEIALALGANVVALGRSAEKLARMGEILGHPKRFQSIVMSGDGKADIAALQRVLPQGADVHSNWSPSGTKEALYLAAVAPVLRQNARVVLSGGAENLGSLPYGLMVLKNISVAGKFMYSRRTVQRLMDLVSLGLLSIGEQSGAIVRCFSLDSFTEAIDTARKHASWRDYTVVTPHKYVDDNE